jgi:hypothetical protein
MPRGRRRLPKEEGTSKDGSALSRGQSSLLSECEESKRLSRRAGEWDGAMLMAFCELESEVSMIMSLWKKPSFAGVEHGGVMSYGLGEREMKAEMGESGVRGMDADMLKKRGEK